MSEESKPFVGEIDVTGHILHDLIPDPTQHYRVKEGIRIIVGRILENMVPVSIMDGDTVVFCLRLTIANPQARSDKPQIRDPNLLVAPDIVKDVILDVCLRFARDKMMTILTEISQGEWQTQF